MKKKSINENFEHKVRSFEVIMQPLPSMSIVYTICAILIFEKNNNIEVKY